MKFKFLCFFIMIGFQAIAQKPYQFDESKILYKNIYNETYKNIDSLQKINSNGTLFIKIDILHKKVKSITFSSEYPTKLIDILQNTIQKSTIKAKSRKLTTFIIPVFYNYKTSLNSSLKDLLNQLPTIDLENLPSPTFQSDFEKFLGIKSVDNTIKGISCIFLPWIKLNGKVI